MSQQEQEDEAERQRETSIRLDEQPEMKRAGYARGVNEFVQFAPALSAQALNHFAGRGDRQGQHQEESCHSKSDKRACYHITGNASKIEVTIKPDVGKEMKESIEKSEEPKHTAKLHEPVQSRNFSRRRNSQRNRQKNQRHHAGRAGDELTWVGTHSFVENVPQQQGQRHQGVHEKHEL